MKTNKKKSQRNKVEPRGRKIGVIEAQQLFNIRCKCCGKKTTIHAYGKNKRLMDEFKTTKPIISSACWNETCKLYGKEVQEIDHRG